MGLRKELLSCPRFNQLPSSVLNPEQGGVIRNATDLRKIVGYDQHRVAPPKADDQVFAAAARERIKRAAVANSVSVRPSPNSL